MKPSVIALGLGIAMTAILATITGCDPRTTDANAEAEAYEPVLYIDRITGCHYLTTGEARALVPRAAPDGIHHMGCGQVQK